MEPSRRQGKAIPKLAYDVLTLGVRADQTPSRLHTIVDANTGATLLSFDEIQTGTGNGIYMPACSGPEADGIAGVRRVCTCGTQPVPHGGR